MTDSVNYAKLRTDDLKRLQDFFEQERDKLYDQVANLQGQKERLDWAIKNINGLILQIEKQEEATAQQLQKQAEAMAVAREKGNVGAHPSERKETIAERKKKDKEEIERQS